MRDARASQAAICSTAMKRLLAIAALLTLLALPTVSGAQERIVLGSQAFTSPYGEGFGTVRPNRISITAAQRVV